MTPRSPYPVVEAMEDRILYSADIAPLVLAGAGADTLVQQAQQQAQQPVHAESAATQVQDSEIVFVDATLPDSASLLNDLQAQRSAGRPIDIVTIGAGEDGLALIGATLVGRHGIAAVHVLAHGSDGALQLGRTTLDAQTLLLRAGEVAAWSAALTTNADLLLYGCDLAHTALGQSLVKDLASLTGADVAASTDLTGAAALGGNWTLEFQSGKIEAALAPSAAEQVQWQGILAIYTVNTTADTLLIILPAPTGSLRWAINQANANPGTDTINFASSANGIISLGFLASGDNTNATGDFDITDSVNIVGNGTANTVISGNGFDRVFDLRGGIINLSGLTIQAGKSSEGAGIDVQAAANVTLTDVVVQGNFGSGTSKGAGIYDHGILTLRNVMVQNNGNTSDDADGAGIFVDSGASLDARNVEIRGNNADSKTGGGLYIKSGGTVTLESVTFAANNANKGGGIWNDSGALSLVNSTLSGNTANSQGGGLWTDAAVSLDHVTVAGNTANVGAGVYDKNGDVSTRNSLFALNTGGGGNTNRAMISLGYNLSDDSSAGFTGTGDLSNVAAGLSPLASNGGFTRTHAISLVSAARDAANPVSARTTDQRGVSYFGGRADIGAYEQNPFGYTPTVSGVANQSVNEDTAMGPQAFSVSDAETAAGGLIVTATSGNTALVPNGNIVIGGSGANRTVTLTPAANANSSANGGAVTITLSVTDGGNSVTTTFIVTVLAVNDAPSMSLPLAQSVVEDNPLTLAGANAPVIADVDAGSAPVQLTLAVTHGLLTLSQTTGLSFVTGNGGNNASMTFNGSLSAVNAALAGLQYRPSANYNGPDQIAFSVNDLGNSGSGGAKTANASLGITVTAFNDAPVLTLPGAQAMPQLTSLAFSTANGNTIALSDLDAGNAALQLTLSTVAGGNGTVTFGAMTGLTLLGGTGSNDTSVVVRGSQADLNAALATLVFTATGAGAAGIDVTVNDLGNSGSGGALQASGTVTITVVNEAPPVLSLAHNNLTFTENDGPTALDPALTVSDADNATLASASIRINNGYAGTQDELRFTNILATMGNIAGSYNAGRLTLTSAGASATLAQWQAALQSVAYANLSESPDTAVRSLTLTVNDGIADSAAQLFTINLTAVNDAPVLSGANVLTAIAEDDTGNAGTLVSTLIAGHTSDVDAMATAGIAVTDVVNSNGDWQYTTNGGVGWTSFGAVTEGNAILLGVDASSAIRFVPNANFNGTVAGGLMFRAWDQSSGSAGGSADASLHGGSTAFSNFKASSGITVAAVNDAPVLAGANNLTTILEDASGNPGTLVSALIGAPVQVTDVDGPQTGIAATAVDNRNGAWQYTLDGGSNWLAFGAVSDGSARLLAADANTSVRFVPNANWNGTVAGGLTFRAWDRSTGITGATADTGSNGANTAFSSAVASSGITVTAVNDAPVLANAIPGQAASQGTAFSFTFAEGTFADVDTGDTLAYGATLSGGAALPSWLNFNVATRTFSGTPANADVGDIVLRVTATDGSGASVFADFTLGVANVNDAPTVVTPIADQGATQGSGFSFTFGAGTFGDIDVGDTLGYGATLSSGAALPTWLNFNAATRTFSGTPGNADVGSFSVRVTATDGSAASVFDDFNLSVANVNDAPTVAAPLVDQSANQGSAFSYTFAAGSFTDLDVGDTLSYGATLSSGAALPTWLNFNAATRTFSGTPANADVGSISVRVIATDRASASVADEFLLSVANINDAPTLATPIPDQVTLQGSALSFTVPAGSFNDVDAGDTLVYGATLSSGAALPSWLGFNAATHSFTGTSGNTDVGSISLRVTVTDGSAISVFDDFTLTVANANHAPTVAAVVPDQAAAQGAPFGFAFAANTFADIDIGDSLNYSASLVSGAALPAWLRFDATTRSFSGTPANADVGAVALRVTATDSGNASASAGFVLRVANVNDAPVLAHAIEGQQAATQTPWVFPLPPATFVDPDVGDTLHYDATLADGSPLPAWLGFDKNTRGFTGHPADADIGRILVRVTATDDAGLSAQGLFAITVFAPPPAEPALPELVQSAPPVQTKAALPAPAPIPVAAALANTSARLAADPESFASAASTVGPDIPSVSITVATAPLPDGSRRDSVDATTATRLASRADTVLAEVLAPQFGEISAAPLNQLLRSAEVTRKFEEMQRQMQQQGEARSAAIATSVLVTGGVSIGYVVWLVRGGVLMSSMWSALPAWQMIDPLPVLAAARSSKQGRKDARGDDADVERLFDQGSPAAPPAVRPPATDAARDAEAKEGSP